MYPIPDELLSALVQHVGSQSESRKWEVIKERRDAFLQKHGREPSGAELGYPDDDVSRLSTGAPLAGPESYSAEDSVKMRGAAQIRFAEVDDKRAAEETQTAERVAMLKEAAAQDDWVRSVGYEPDQMLSEPDKGILVEEIPADKLMRIRQQAADRGPGYTGGKGSFSQQDMTPEIAQRQADMDKWVAGQSVRDAQFAASPDQARRDPATAELASDRLAGLQQQQRLSSRQANVDTIIESMAGSSGKISPDLVQQLQMLDPSINIPGDRIGVSAGQATTMLQNEISVLSDAANKLSAQVLLDGDNRLEATNQLAAAAQRALMLLSRPGVDPNVVIAEYRAEATKLSMEYMPQQEAMVGGHEYERVD